MFQTTDNCAHVLYKPKLKFTEQITWGVLCVSCHVWYSIWLGVICSLTLSRKSRMCGRHSRWVLMHNIWYDSYHISADSLHVCQILINQIRQTKQIISCSVHPLHTGISIYILHCLLLTQSFLFLSQVVCVGCDRARRSWIILLTASNPRETTDCTCWLATTGKVMSYTCRPVLGYCILYLKHRCQLLGFFN